MVRQWLINAGCERIFMVNNVTREGIDELMEYLQEDTPKLTLEQAKFKQSLGLNEWDPLPEEWLIRKKKRICYKNSHSDFPVIWMGIFIWYVAYVNYGIKEMYCFNRQRLNPEPPGHPESPPTVHRSYYIRYWCNN